MLEFTKETLERLSFVIETKGMQPKVIKCFEGLESVCIMALLNRSIKLTRKQVCRVFGKDGSYRGFIMMNENGFPDKYPEESELKFNDFYTVGGNN